MTERLPGPVSEGERIVALDVLRGFAILGILLVNIQVFSMVAPAYQNPASGSMWGGADTVVWATTFLLADQKFMTIFAMLFGAGIVLSTSRAEARGASPARYHFVRTFWLLLIGLMHAYLLWYGDILVFYSLCALLVFWFRRLSPRWLIVWGLVIVAVSSGLQLFAGLTMPFWPPEAVADMNAGWAPERSELLAEIEIYRSGWLAQMEHRVPHSFLFHTFIFLFWALWRAGGLMLVGMALFKLGVLTASRDDAFYRRLVVICLPLGYAIVAYGIWSNLAAGFDLRYSMFLGSQFNYWASVLVSLGYIGLVMLAVRNDWLAGMQRRLAAAGRMALTNYLGQTIICTFVFYGHGLGQFERWHRPAQVALVVAIWVFQLWLSPWWLARFRFGPFEWVWRSLTYMKPQPMRP